MEKIMLCQYCSKECKNLNSLKQHEKRCKSNPNRLDMSGPNNPRYGLKGSNQFTKAKELGKEIKVSDKTREKLRKANTGYAWSNERKEAHSKRMRQAVLDNPDSYSASNVSGRVKTYEFDGFKFKGTWELKVAKFLKEHNIKYTNKIKPIPYEWEGSEHLYFPDFYLPTYDFYIEVKGYKRDRDLCKWKALENLVVLEKDEISDLSCLLNKLRPAGVMDSIRSF